MIDNLAWASGGGPNQPETTMAMPIRSKHAVASTLAEYTGHDWAVLRYELPGRGEQWSVIHREYCQGVAVVSEIVEPRPRDVASARALYFTDPKMVLCKPVAGDPPTLVERYLLLIPQEARKRGKK